MENTDLLTLEFEGTEINCPIAEGHRMIPVKTVCTIIDVDYQTQDSWLKKHKYFGQLYSQDYTVGTDNRTRLMNCLSAFDLISWLASISENKRRDGSIEKQYAFMAWLRNEMVDMYKLIEVFQKENDYELQLIETKAGKVEKMVELNAQVSELKRDIKQIDNSINEVREKRFTGQTALPFPDQK